MLFSNCDISKVLDGLLGKSWGLRCSAAVSGFIFWTWHWVYQYYTVYDKKKTKNKSPDNEPSSTFQWAVMFVSSSQSK